MTKTEKAIQWMEQTANDSSHGYDQLYRWGEKGDYDCSSAVITAWEKAGVPVKTSGATWTGNMYSVFLKCGFSDVTKNVNLHTGAGLVRGDVLLNTTKHTAMFCGDGKEVEASINEHGGTVRGTPGDQTGKEFLIRSYRNFPWNYVLRFNEQTEEPVKTSEPSQTTETKPVTQLAKYRVMAASALTETEALALAKQLPDDHYYIYQSENGWWCVQVGAYNNKKYAQARLKAVKNVFADA